MQKKTTLVFGKDGQVGRALQSRLVADANVIFLGRNELDLTHPAAIQSTLEKYQPHTIINAAAYTAVDRAEQEPEIAQLMNAVAPEIMAKYINQVKGGVLVHYSTDYVFDGNKASPYLETDTTNPLGVYGKSKCAGEQAITHIFSDNPHPTARYYILRTSWVYGQGNNFIKTILKLAQERESLRIIQDQYGVPTSGEWLAQITLQLISSDIGSGIYHAVPDGKTNWHALGTQVIDYAQSLGAPIMVTPENIFPIPASEYPLPAPRPLNSCLNHERLKIALAQSPQNSPYPFWHDPIDAYVKSLVNGLQVK
jgi:dTDP-4-dehydrorhamnose reductase